MFGTFHEDTKVWWSGRDRRRFHFAQAVMNCKRAGYRDAARAYWLGPIATLDRQGLEGNA